MTLLQSAKSAPSTMTLEELQSKARWVRQKVLEMSVAASSGHISTAMSQTDLLVALFHGRVLRFDPRNPKWVDRDRFILSKGQGGIGTYPVLADLGFFALEELDHFTAAGSRLGVHAEWNVPGTEILSGSLGHGLPIATGMALACKLDGRDSLVVCFLGDGELYEGSNWEAMFFAGKYGLDNLVCIVDRNGQSCLGFTELAGSRRDGPGLDPIDAKFEAFGFESRVIDGHDFGEIFLATADLRERRTGKPLAIVANTSKGKGISFMEDARLWHYRVPKGDDLVAARGDLAVPPCEA